jgi:hypothetical protein
VGNSGHVIFCQEFPHNERGVCRRIVMVQQPVSVLTYIVTKRISVRDPQLLIEIPLDVSNVL